MVTSQKELLYFGLRLLELLHTNIPEKAYDNKFINNLASPSFERLQNSGSWNS